MKSNSIYIILLFALGLSLGFSGCKKSTALTDEINTKQEVYFSSSVMYGGEKGIALNGSGVDYALIQIDTTIYRPEVFNLNNKLYTQAIKLLPGNYSLAKFMLMNDNATPDYYDDDFIVLATPTEGSDYAAFVNRPAGFSFEVNHLKKADVSVDVIYFNESDYDKFGFGFDMLPATTIREQKFTGVFIPKNPADYSGSLYEQQPSGLQNQMPAIFTIDVYRNGRFVTSFNNEQQLGLSPVTVSYPDSDNSDDYFRFDLKVYVKFGVNFEYRYVKSWEFLNDEMIETKTDGLVHFILGNSATNSDITIGPYINLPSSLTYIIQPAWAPGNLGAYFDAKLDGITTGFSIGNGYYRSWCGTDSVSININHVYDMDVYSSLLPETLPIYTRNAEKWNEINWLFNNLNSFNNISWQEIQGAVWKILNDWDGVGHSNIPDADNKVNELVSEAVKHPYFIPVTGQKAAVILVPKGTSRNTLSPVIQLVFIFSYL